MYFLFLFDLRPVARPAGSFFSASEEHNVADHHGVASGVKVHHVLESIDEISAFDFEDCFAYFYFIVI